jgi:zinc D-Ala-D-Ala carboxypeptidase
MKKISENISYKEAVHSETAKRLGISNKPKKEHIENMELIAEKIFQPLRDWVDHPIRINSMYRSEELNSRIGGAISSAHKEGLAIDLDSLGGKTNLEMLHYIKDHLEFDVLISEYPNQEGEPKWIHVSWNKKKNRKQVLEIKRKGRYYTYTGCKGCK